MGCIFKDLKVIETDFSVNWENGASGARAGAHLMKATCFPCL